MYSDPIERTGVSVRETAYMLDISEWTVYRLLREGKLTRHKIGKRTLLNRAEVLALLGQSDDQECG